MKRSNIMQETINNSSLTQLAELILTEEMRQSLDSLSIEVLVHLAYSTELPDNVLTEIQEWRKRNVEKARRLDQTPFTDLTMLMRSYLSTKIRLVEQWTFEELVLYLFDELPSPLIGFSYFRGVARYVAAYAVQRMMLQQVPISLLRRIRTVVDPSARPSVEEEVRRLEAEEIKQMMPFVGPPSGDVNNAAFGPPSWFAVVCKTLHREPEYWTSIRVQDYQVPKVLEGDVEMSEELAKRSPKYFADEMFYYNADLHPEIERDVQAFLLFGQKAEMVQKILVDPRPFYRLDLLDWTIRWTKKNSQENKWELIISYKNNRHQMVDPIPMNRFDCMVLRVKLFQAVNPEQSKVLTDEEVVMRWKSAGQSVEKKQKEEALREKARQRSHQKIEARIQARVEAQNLEDAFLEGLLEPIVLYPVDKSALKEIFLSVMNCVALPEDIQNYMFRMYRVFMESRSTNQRQTKERGWTGGHFISNYKEGMAESVRLMLENPVEIALASKAIGLPMWLFTSSVYTYVSVDDFFDKGKALYFAVQLPDKQIRARIVRGLPSGWTWGEHEGVCEQLVGAMPEPIMARFYPHGLDRSDWTVFRLLPNTVHSLDPIWICVFDNYGLISARLMFTSKKYKTHDVSDYLVDPMGDAYVHDGQMIVNTKYGVVKRSPVFTAN